MCLSLFSFFNCLWFLMNFQALWNNYTIPKWIIQIFHRTNDQYCLSNFKSYFRYKLTMKESKLTESTWTCILSNSNTAWKERERINWVHSAYICVWRWRIIIQHLGHISKKLDDKNSILLIFLMTTISCFSLEIRRLRIHNIRYLCNLLIKEILHSLHQQER